MTDTNQRKPGSTLWGIVCCLTSLDDLIAAQTQKFNAIKTRKKGLLQQLFPVQDKEGA